MNKIELAKCFEEEAYDLMFYGFDKDDNLQKLANLSSRVLEKKDPFISYAFVSRISWYCFENEKYKRALNVSAHERLVVNSYDEELMYLFARDVAGANLQNITHSMPKNSHLRKQLEREMRPLDEYNL